MYNYDPYAFDDAPKLMRHDPKVTAITILAAAAMSGEVLAQASLFPPYPEKGPQQLRALGGLRDELVLLKGELELFSGYVLGAQFHHNPEYGSTISLTPEAAPSYRKIATAMLKRTTAIHKRAFEATIVTVDVGEPIGTPAHLVQMVGLAYALMGTATDLNLDNTLNRSLQLIHDLASEASNLHGVLTVRASGA